MSAATVGLGCDCCATLLTDGLAATSTLPEGYDPASGEALPRHITSDDGSGLAEKCGGLEAERRSRVEQWRHGLSTDFGRPTPERMRTGGQAWDTPSCPLTPLGRRLLGLDPWPEEAYAAAH